MDISSDDLHQTKEYDSGSGRVGRALPSSHIGRLAQSSADICDRFQRMTEENLQKYEQWRDLSQSVYVPMREKLAHSASLCP